MINNISNKNLVLDDPNHIFEHFNNHFCNIAKEIEKEIKSQKKSLQITSNTLGKHLFHKSNYS